MTSLTINIYHDIKSSYLNAWTYGLVDNYMGLGPTSKYKQIVVGLEMKKCEELRKGVTIKAFVHMVSKFDSGVCAQF